MLFYGAAQYNLTDLNRAWTRQTVSRQPGQMASKVFQKLNGNDTRSIFGELDIQLRSRLHGGNVGARSTQRLD